MRAVVVLIGLLAASPVWAQERLPVPLNSIPGIPVDGRGGPTIDPTKNVLDLVQAESKFQNGMREAEIRRQVDLREADGKFGAAMREANDRRVSELREAETRRVNELAAQKQVFDLELARVIRANVDSSTLLLATQLKEVKTDSGDRMAKLEQFANEQRGKASQLDPANIKLLEEVRLLSQQRATTVGQSEGMSSLWALIVGGIMALVGILGVFAAFMRVRGAAA